MDLLIVVPRLAETEEVNYSYAFPLGLSYISAVLKKTGHNVDCFNMNHYSGPTSTIIKDRLKQGRIYDHVLTGGLSTDFRQIKAVVEGVRIYGAGAGVIMGGAIIASEPELMFNTLGIDHAVIGEGEITVVELLECLKKKGDLSKVAGIGYRGRDGKFVCTKQREYISDLETIPWPDLESFEYEIHLDHKHPSDENWIDLFDKPRVYPIVCSRSCPFMCTFCFHQLGRKYRQRSVDSVLEELTDRIKRYRINIIAIYDDLFSNDREWLYEFCRRMKAFLKELTWECKWYCQMRVIDVDEEILTVMKDAGCFLISYGFESYDPDVLKSMNKHITPAQIDRAIQMTLKHNMSVQGNFIFGDLAETPRSVKGTLDYYKKNPYAGIQLGLINPYPGSAIYHSCVKRKVIKDRIDFISNHIFDAFNMTETMTGMQYRKMFYEMFRAKALYRIASKKWELKKMQDGTFKICAKCPHCGAVNEYQNFLLSSRYVYNRSMFCRSCRYRFYLVSFLYYLFERSLVAIGTVFPGSLYLMKVNANVLRNAVRSLKKLVKQVGKREVAA